MNIVGEDNFVGVFVNTSIEICEERDFKGLYKKTRLGLIPKFTGIFSPYEKPEYPDLELSKKNQLRRLLIWFSIV